MSANDDLKGCVPLPDDQGAVILINKAASLAVRLASERTLSPFDAAIAARPEAAPLRAWLPNVHLFREPNILVALHRRSALAAFDYWAREVIHGGYVVVPLYLHDDDVGPDCSSRAVLSSVRRMFDALPDRAHGAEWLADYFDDLDSEFHRGVYAVLMDGVARAYQKAMGLMQPPLFVFAVLEEEVKSRLFRLLAHPNVAFLTI